MQRSRTVQKSSLVFNVFAMKFLSKRIFIITTIVLVISFSCSKDDNTTSNTDTTGLFTQTLTHDGITREYILYIPSSYNGTSEVPLLFNFHGFGGEASDYMNYVDMRSLAEAENFILVYPQGTLLQGSTHWNPSLPHPNNKSSADDLGFIETLINQLSSDYMIDSERIYACGYSNGAMMSYGLAFHKSDLMAAVGSISGAMLDTDIIPSHPMPVIVFHGTSDGVLPYNGSSEFNSIDTVLAYWIGFNNTHTTPTINRINDNGTIIEHYSYTDGNNNTSVEHYKITGGGHVWFDISYDGSNTSQLIWDFVSRYDINGLR